MTVFTQTQWDKARDYLFSHGRPLEQARFRVHFEDGDPADVLAALAAFQNDDGGFGHAIEPDLRTPASSVIGTSTALHILREIDLHPQHPMLAAAARFLNDQFDPDQRVWPIVPPAVEDAPHAPWWFYESSSESFGGFVHNPRAEVLGHLLHFGLPAPDGLLDEVITALHALPEKMQLYDMRSYLGLADAHGLSGGAREALDRILGARLPLTVSGDPDSWGGHGALLPLAAAPLPDSYAAQFIDPDWIEANLDYEIASQNRDGSWGVGWNWADFGADAWAQAEQDWKSILILDRLRSIKAYGRTA